MLKNEDALLTALYIEPELLQQAVSQDREAAFAAIHQIVPDWTPEDYEKFYEGWSEKYLSLMYVIDAAVRDEQIRDKIFSEDKVFAYKAAQEIATGYTQRDFQQFMEQHADLVFQCMAAEFMSLGKTPLDEETLENVAGGTNPLTSFLDFIKLLKKFVDAGTAPKAPSKEKQLMKARSVVPDIVDKILRLLAGHCFVAGSMVATPQGDKPIEQIQAGDEVLGADAEGKIIHCRVTEVLAPAKERIFTVRFHNGSVWHTTDSQWFYTGTEFYSLLNIRKHTALTVQGKQVAIDEVIRTERVEMVYDFAVDGYNVIFINGVAAEGYSRK